MLDKLVRQALVATVKGTVRFEEPMSKHTSFHIGGPAEALVTPRDLEDLKKILHLAAESVVPLTIVGNGTKLLVSDDGIEGITVKISGCLDNLRIAGPNVEVGAGYSLAYLSRTVARVGLSGLEFAIGIPGTIGGAVVMNAGAHESSISDVLTRALAINFNGEIRHYSRREIGFSFRRSVFQNANSIVLSAEMCLETDMPNEVKKRMDKHIRWRRENQPLDFPNAGSIFKNPEGLVAGRLIDDCGLKGMKIGDAQISEKRANFIVNLSNAQASEVSELMTMVQDEVFEKFGIRLEPEIRLVGKFCKEVFKGG